MQDISAYINEHIISATEKMNDGNFIKAEEEIHTTLEIDKKLQTYICAGIMF